MRTIPLLLALAFLGTAAGVAIPTVPPTCAPLVVAKPCIIISDLNVPAGTSQHADNGTYLVTGKITVHGSFSIAGSTMVFDPHDAQPVHVFSGGAFYVNASSLQGEAIVGAPPILLADTGAKVQFHAGTFNAADVDVAGNDITIDGGTLFTGGDPALMLRDFNGTLAGDTQFNDNLIGLNVTGGAPSLEDLRFNTNKVSDVELFHTGANVLRMTTVHSNFGIRSLNSHGSYESMTLMEDELPPTRGIFLQSSDAKIYVNDTSIQNFGVGIECHDSDYDANGDSFVNDGQDATDDNCSGAH